jgi:hypothetical protein
VNRNQASKFLRGYLDAALFTTDETPPSGEDYIESGRAAEMFPKLPHYFIQQAEKDCAAFQAANADLLAKAGDDWQNGADFWYTRNGHGVGFWDRGYPDEVADPLSDAARKCGEVYLMPDEIGQGEGEE